MFGSDLDDCILITAPFILKRLGTSLLDKLTRFSISSCLNISEEKVITAINNTLKDPLPFDPTFLDHYQTLLTRFGRIHVITARTNHLNPARQALSKLSPDLILHQVPTFNLNPPNKAALISKLNLKYFVEDRYATAIDIAQKTTCTVFLLSKPWNKRPFTSKKVIRVNSWDEIINHLV